MAGTPQPLPLTGGRSIELDTEGFLRSLLSHLAGTLEEVVGLQDAVGFISVVGQRLGEEINALYLRVLGLPRLSREQVAAVLVDLKARIQGDFFIISQDDQKIVLGNRACPFAEKVAGHPSLCMMTSNVFGVIASENLGYAKVSLEQTIAQGSPGCRVVIYLDVSAAEQAPQGREYLRT